MVADSPVLVSEIWCQKSGVRNLGQKSQDLIAIIPIVEYNRRQ